jgi:membrane-bound ClpP family serine protease
MTASRARWIVVWLLIVLWLVTLAFNIGGNWSLVLLVAGIALLVYELVAEEPERS